MVPQTQVWSQDTTQSLYSIGHPIDTPQRDGDDDVVVVAAAALVAPFTYAIDFLYGELGTEPYKPARRGGVGRGARLTKQVCVLFIS